MKTDQSLAGINPSPQEDKIMKKIFYMAVAAIAALSSCSNENDIIGEGGKQNGEGVTTFTATIESDATSRTTYNSTSKKSEWIASTDKINVGGAEYTADLAGATTTFSGTGATTGSDSKYHAYYPSSMVSGTIVTLPATYTYETGKFNMPMYAESETTSLAFKNLCGVLAITVPSSQMSTIKTFEVSSNEQMWGEFTVKMSGTPAVPTITFASKTLTEDDKKITINCGSGVAGGSTFYVPVPANTYYPITIKVSDGTNTKIMHTTKQDGVAIARNSIYAISFTENYAKIGTSSDINLLPGEFRVASNRTVRFTRSNLYWNGTAWHFEANQVGYPTSWNTNHVSHFYWSKTASVAYAETYSDPSASRNDNFFCGDNNKITVEGTSGLFVLSNDEWKYLISSRTNASDLLKYGQTVGGKTNCLLIAPDGFDTSKWHISNSYTLEEVNSLGLVCLPAAAHRNGSTLGERDSYGNYWSSKSYDLQTGSDYAYLLRFDSRVVETKDQYRGRGQSLRLVVLPQ